MPTQQKKEIVAKLAERLERAEAIYFTNYQGLSHQELENLRRKIKELDADYSIVKNTLFRIALKKVEETAQKTPGVSRPAPLTEGASGSESPNVELQGPTAVLFAYQDPLKPLQVYAENFKDRLKAALAYGEYITGEKLQKLVDLEPEEVLHTKLVTQLVSPMYGLAHALNWNMQRLAVVLNEVKQQKGGD